MKLSIVTTLYCSSPYLNEFHRRISAQAENITDDYEIIMVNDGSPDNSLELARKLLKFDKHVRIVDLSRNFGHHAAIVAGLENTSGDLVFLMDCDLEEQPEWLPLFYAEMQSSGSDVVFGVQEKRVSSTVSNLLGSLFWKSLNLLSNVRIPENPMTCRLMNRAYVDALLQVGDRVLYLAGVFAWAGYRQKALPLSKIPRPTEHKSTYNISRKLLQVADSFASFSVAPLYLIFISGAFIWLTSIIGGVHLLIQKMLNPEAVLSGFASAMLSIWFLSGTMILAIGIIGLYVAKIFQEVKRRPLFMVRKVYGGNEDE